MLPPSPYCKSKKTTEKADEIGPYKGIGKKRKIL